MKGGLTLVVMCLVVCSINALCQTQASGQVWTDPDTKLMWAASDNGGYKPPDHGLLTQQQAAAYCKDSHLAGFHDWRLPTIEELAQVYDKAAAGKVKGGVIKLSGDPTGTDNHMYAQMSEWSQSERADQDAIWEFDFRVGDRMTWVGGGYARALCVRGASAKLPVAAKTAVADMSQYVSADGITIPSGASGAPRGSGVFFTTIEDRELPISLLGDPTLATLNYTGTMEASHDGKLAGGTENFKPTRIKTSKNPDRWLRIVSFSIGKDGLLVIKDELGASYRIKVAPIDSTGTIEELGKKTE